MLRNFEYTDQVYFNPVTKRWGSKHNKSFFTLITLGILDRDGNTVSEERLNAYKSRELASKIIRIGTNQAVIDALLPTFSGEDLTYAYIKIQEHLLLKREKIYEDQERTRTIIDQVSDTVEQNINVPYIKSI